MRRMMSIPLLIATAIASASVPDAISVSFNELVEHPQKYSGKRVSLRAYVVTSCTHCGDFWASVDAARHFWGRRSKVQQSIAIGDLARGFTLPKLFSDRLRHQQYDGYVQVSGVFEYMPITTRILPSSTQQPKSPATGQSERVIVEGTSAFGWMGIHDKQITQITEFRPLGPAIPARLE